MSTSKLICVLATGQFLLSCGHHYRGVPIQSAIHGHAPEFSMLEGQIHADACVDTTIATLGADPASYNGRHVCVTGFFGRIVPYGETNFELFATRREAEARQADLFLGLGIRWDVMLQARLARHSEEFVRVEGIFEHDQQCWPPPGQETSGYRCFPPRPMRIRYALLRFADGTEVRHPEFHAQVAAQPSDDPSAVVHMHPSHFADVRAISGYLRFNSHSRQLWDDAAALRGNDASRCVTLINTRPFEADLRNLDNSYIEIEGFPVADVLSGRVDFGACNKVGFYVRSVRALAGHSGSGDRSLNSRGNRTQANLLHNAPNPEPQASAPR